VPLTKDAIGFAKQYMGEENVITLDMSMTAEDFSYYSHEVPSCFYRLGTANTSKGITDGLHTSRFNIDEEALKVGMGLMVYLAIKN
jgi:metal-dependent amidase/aminoacylase/carboxypeptidase family protein